MKAIRSSAQIQSEVLQELKWDSRVDESEIGVAAADGVVTLTGTVDSYARKLAAQEAAHRVAGVLDVANDIQVRVFSSATPTDTEIAQAVRHALEWDVWVPDERIRSTVSNGWVTLEGTVDLIRESEDAERAIRHLAGVRGVTNKIFINAPAVEPDYIRQTIEHALERRAEREAHHIQVEVKDGEVTLTGRVRSWEEKRAVMGAVAHAPGVRGVKDRLVINPYM
ncbi:MAG: BON domain-containing protein [Acidobacteriota bacterium]